MLPLIKADDISNEDYELGKIVAYTFYSDYFPIKSKNGSPTDPMPTKFSKKYWQRNKFTNIPRIYELISCCANFQEIDIQNHNKDSDNVKKEPRKLFKIALETTNYPFYVTDKIWHSIKSGYLPIYWSNSTIYTDFPEESFIDAHLFCERYGEKWCQKLLEYIKTMPTNEYISRMNKCINAFNKICVKYAKLKEHNTTNTTGVDYSRNWPEFKSMFI